MPVTSKKPTLIKSKGILSKALGKRVEIVIDGVSDNLAVRELNTSERMKFAERFKEAKGDVHAVSELNAWVIALCLLKDGVPAYDTESSEDIREILESPNSVQNLILEAIYSASGLTKTAAEDAEKN